VLAVCDVIVPKFAITEVFIVKVLLTAADTEKVLVPLPARIRLFAAVTPFPIVWFAPLNV